MTTIDRIRTAEISSTKAELISLCLDNEELARGFQNLLNASEDEQRYILSLTDPDALMEAWSRYTA